jgi:hypothetical protein
MSQQIARVSTPSGPPAMFSRSRLVVVLAASLLLGLLLSIPNETATYIVLFRALVVGFGSLVAFGLLERWPAREPERVPRWVLQLLGIVIVVPFATWFAYWLTTGGHTHLDVDQKRQVGYLMLAFTGVFFAPWIALAAMLRQREAFARTQALAFQLERSELERRAIDARFRVLQAQVAPHFLFNTLANVQALVDAGSPQASDVLKSLVAYLRAAMPRLQESSTTLGQELELVRAYLEVMRMRMPDRLAFALNVDRRASGIHCPPMTVLTLVENSVRHGIDPAEEGGRIDVDVRLQGGRCRIVVTDSGVGIRETDQGLGTGLTALRERIGLAYGGDAQLQLSAVGPHGVCATLDIPAEEGRS